MKKEVFTAVMGDSSSIDIDYAHMHFLLGCLLSLTITQVNKYRVSALILKHMSTVLPYIFKDNATSDAKYIKHALLDIYIRHVLI